MVLMGWLQVMPHLNEELCKELLGPGRKEESAKPPQVPQGAGIDKSRGRHCHDHAVSKCSNLELR